MTATTTTLATMTKVAETALTDETPAPKPEESHGQNTVSHATTDSATTTKVVAGTTTTD